MKKLKIFAILWISLVLANCADKLKVYIQKALVESNRLCLPREDLVDEAAPVGATTALIAATWLLRSRRCAAWLLMVWFCCNLFHPRQLLTTDSGSLIQEQIESSSNLSESSNEYRSLSSHSSILIASLLIHACETHKNPCCVNLGQSYYLEGGLHFSTSIPCPNHSWVPFSGRKKMGLPWQIQSWLKVGRNRPLRLSKRTLLGT